MVGHIQNPGDVLAIVESMNDELETELNKVKLGENLTEPQKQQLHKLLREFSDVSAMDQQKPRSTDLIEHVIETGDAMSHQNVDQKIG